MLGTERRAGGEFLCFYLLFLGEVKAKIKRSARDEMEAMADRLVFTAPTGEKRADKSDFWKQLQVIPLKTPPPPPSSPRLDDHGRATLCGSERGSLPQQPSPAAAEPRIASDMSGVGDSLATQPPNKHRCLFKEKPQKWEHVGPTCSRSLSKKIAHKLAGCNLHAPR